MLRTLEEKVDPAHAALLIIDLQHDYCSPGGEAHKAGRRSNATSRSFRV